jgi:hypothetical protein
MHIFRLSLPLALLCNFAAASPRFEDYPAPAYSGKSAPVQIKGVKSRRYAGQLRAMARRPANFAGHYVLAAWGCGASCVMAAAIDAKTGTVSWVPFTVCCWDVDVTEPLEYRQDSRLLITHGSRDEHGAGSDTNYYWFDGRRFIPIR